MTALHKMMHLYCFAIVFWLCVIAAEAEFVDNPNKEPCPPGWTQYKDEVPTTCVMLSDYEVHSMGEAHNSCLANDSSLMVVQSQTKFDFFEAMFQDLERRENGRYLWLGLQKFGDEVTWLTKDGAVPAEWYPSGTEFNFSSNWKESDHHYYGHYDYSAWGDYYKGLWYSYGKIQFAWEYGSAFFICEQRPPCKDGWFGASCEKQCHCYGQECDATALEITCDFGCQLGWMGHDCTQPKVDAEVRYYCFNSPTEGLHALVKVDTKGTPFQVIEPTNEAGMSFPWCNTTSIHRNDGVVSLKILVDDYTTETINNGVCPGKIINENTYEWLIKIQEIPGLVSRFDRYLRMRCDFRYAQVMQISHNALVKKEGDRDYRRNDIQRKVKTLSQRREAVTLMVINPTNDEPIVYKTSLGVSLAIKIEFGHGNGNQATGLIPHNCNATSGLSSQSFMFIDGHGCPVPGVPISGFNQVSPHAIVTNPFPFFGFSKAQKVIFRCAYTLCFNEEPCTPMCGSNRFSSTTSSTTSSSTTNTNYNYTTTTPTTPWYNHYHYWTSTTPSYRGRRSVRDYSKADQNVMGSVIISP